MPRNVDTPYFKARVFENVAVFRLNAYRHFVERSAREQAALLEVGILYQRAAVRAGNYRDFKLARDSARVPYVVPVPVGEQHRREPEVFLF